MSKHFMLVSAVAATTKPREGSGLLPEPFFRCRVQPDATLDRIEYERKTGKKLFNYTQGGTSYGWAVLKTDPNYAMVEAWLKEPVESRGTFLIEGEVHVVDVIKHFVVNPNTNEKVLDKNNNPETSDKLTFFLPTGDSVVSTTRRLCRNLEPVTESEPTPADAVL